MAKITIRIKGQFATKLQMMAYINDACEASYATEALRLWARYSLKRLLRASERAVAIYAIIDLERIAPGLDIIWRKA